MREDTFPLQWTGQQARVVLPEHIDASNAGQIREELLSAINQGAEALIADMTATTSCDLAGADAVARAYQRAVASRTELRLVVTSAPVLRMLGMTGVGRLVPVYPSVAAALAARSPAASSTATPADAVRAGEVRRRHLAGAPRAAGLAGAPRAAGLTADERPAFEADVGVEVALLDRDGVIAWVNPAWQAFAAANGGDPDRAGRGVSYLQACAAAGDDPAAQDVAAAIRAALAGDLPAPLVVEVPCHSPAAGRWFDVLISSRLADDGRVLGATVTLSLARSQPRRRPARPAPGTKPAGGHGLKLAAAAATPPDVLWKMIDAFADGVALADSDGTLVLASRRLEEMFGYQPTELTGYPVERLIPAQLQAAHRGHLAAYRQAPSDRPMGAGARLTGRRKNGTTFPAEISLSQVPTATGRLTLAVVRDVTAARRLAVARQDQSSQHLLDRVVTTLYQVGISLQAPADPPRDTATHRIEEVLDVLSQLISQIRDTAFTGRDG